MRKLTFTLFGLYLVLLLFVGLFALGCEPGGWLTIENQSSHDVTIYVTVISTDGPLEEPNEPINYGIVQAQSTKELAAIVFPRRTWVHRIQAVDPSGKVVFSGDYNMDDLEKIDWKIVIPRSAGE